jgi:DNA-binding YbaB/EbfC family protein
MGSGYAKKKKEAKMLQQKFQEMQEKMKHETSTGISGNGMVTITLNGEHEMIGIKIRPDCVDPDDIEGLQDLIRAAYQDALKKLESSTGPIPGMPGGFSPF